MGSIWLMSPSIAYAAAAGMGSPVYAGARVELILQQLMLARLAAAYAHRPTTHTATRKLMQRVSRVDTPPLPLLLLFLPAGRLWVLLVVLCSC
jgi:hypothetical protein